MKKGQYHSMFQSEDDYWWFKAKREFIKNILPENNGNLNILDVGCGTGGTTKFLAKWGSVTGIEPSAEARPFLKKRKIKFKSVSFEKFSSRKKFDLVCFLDVLYHKNITDDRNAIKKAASFLNKGGLILITDCALPFLVSAHDTIMQARQRYYLRDLADKLKSAGLSIKKASYIFFLVFPLFSFARLIMKKGETGGISRLHPLINLILFNLCRLEAKLLKFVNFPIGSSVIILAEKK